jgi:3-hydroxyisobutyrate dehydrogenase-like beta-hydroxyacid dehydrogenase
MSPNTKGERRLDVAEFLAVCSAVGADPVRILKALIKNHARSWAAESNISQLVHTMDARTASEAIDTLLNEMRSRLDQAASREGVLYMRQFAT